MRQPWPPIQPDGSHTSPHLWGPIRVQQNFERNAVQPLATEGAEAAPTLHPPTAAGHETAPLAPVPQPRTPAAAMAKPSRVSNLIRTPAAATAEDFSDDACCRTRRRSRLARSRQSRPALA